MPSRTLILLAVSLVLNAVLFGLVVGREASDRAPTAKMDFERYGPTSDVVLQAWSQLPEADRVELRRQIRDLYAAMAPDRARLHDAGNTVYAAALSDPFDEPTLRDALVLFQHRERVMQRQFEDVLIRRLGKMPPEARATAAVGLLTPFNARVRRVDVGDREAESFRQEFGPEQLEAQAARPAPTPAPEAGAEGTGPPPT
jgi:uncharacterized membrane protein